MKWWKQHATWNLDELGGLSCPYIINLFQNLLLQNGLCHGNRYAACRIPTTRFVRMMTLVEHLTACSLKCAIQGIVHPFVVLLPVSEQVEWQPKKIRADQ